MNDNKLPTTPEEVQKVQQQFMEHQRNRDKMMKKQIQDIALPIFCARVSNQQLMKNFGITVVKGPDGKNAKKKDIVRHELLVDSIQDAMAMIQIVDQLQFKHPPQMQQQEDEEVKLPPQEEEIIDNDAKEQVDKSVDSIEQDISKHAVEDTKTVLQENILKPEQKPIGFMQKTTIPA